MISLPPEARSAQPNLPSDKRRGRIGFKQVPETVGDVWFIVLTYVGIATIWIFATDRLVKILNTSLEESQKWSIVKGVCFVVLTGALLYGLISRLVLRWKRLNESLSASEEKYRLLIDHSPDGILINRNNHVAFVNPAALRIFAAKEEQDMIGRPALSIIHPDCHEAVLERIRLLSENHSVSPMVEKIVRLDGEVMEAEIAAVPFVDQNGSAIMVMVRDISERLCQELEIRRLNRLYSVLSQVNLAVARVSSREELFHEVCWIVVGFGEFKMSWLGWIDPETHEVAPVASAGHGVDFKNRRKHYAVDDLPEGRGLTGIAIREERVCVTNDYTADPRTQPWQQAADTFGFHSGIALPISNGGKVCGALMAYSGERNYFQTKEVKLLEEVARDISMALDRLDEEVLQKRMEEELQKSEEKFRCLFNASRDAILLLDDDEYIDCNSAALTMYAYPSKEQFCARKFGDNSPPLQPGGQNSVVLGRELLKTALKTGRHHFEWVARRFDGSDFPAEISLNSFDLKGRTVLQVVVRDISQRKQTEEALKKSEEKFSKAFNLTPAIITLTTLEENQIIEANERFFEVLGYIREESIGRTMLELELFANPEDSERFTQKLLTEGSLRNEEYQYRAKTGELFFGLLSAELIDVEGKPCVLSITLDITERKQMEEKFLRVQRMESIGALAGGMAHDLNNILAPIMMSASMLQEKRISAEARSQLAAGIEEAAQRGANIVNQVLTFARGVKGEHTVINTLSLAAQIERIVKETFPKSITFTLSVPDTLWNITGDFTQLQQVFLNLFVNARDAMPEGGFLSLGVENCEVDSTFVFMVPEAKPGCYVRFDVKDCGTGIPKEIIDRIFEPFFTTKEPGKGTGLGLSTAVGIIRSHGGFLKVKSEPGKGSIFQVFLPATQAASPEPVLPDQLSVSRGQGETILIVDDEPEISQIIGTVLEQNGWKVECAADGRQGLSAYMKQPGKIKVLVTDMVMPNMDGLHLIRAIRKLDPDLPIIISSGYSNEENRDELSEMKVSAYLKKPFSARQLLTTVSSVLRA